MNTVIYYFSGTGNSLKVARDISAALGDAELKNIAEIKGEGKATEADCTGIVFPVYAYGLPLIVSRFIAGLKPDGKDGYIFAVATCRDKTGGALGQAAKLLEKNGLKLSAGFTVRMPGNYIYSYDADTAGEQNGKFRLWDEKLGKIVTIIENRERCLDGPGLLKRSFQSRAVYGMASSMFNRWDRRFYTSESCNGCGICQKICPVNNIEIREGKPVWQHRCEQCFACINWCPVASIQCTEKTAVRSRYHHPEIKLKDMLTKK